jgi:hypothetical protein
LSFSKTLDNGNVKRMASAPYNISTLNSKTPHPTLFIAASSTVKASVFLMCAVPI